MTGQSQESLLQLQLLLLYVVKFNALFYLMSNPAEANQEYSLYLHFQMFMFGELHFYACTILFDLQASNVPFRPKTESNITKQERSLSSRMTWAVAGKTLSRCSPGLAPQREMASNGP